MNQLSRRIKLVDNPEVRELIRINCESAVDQERVRILALIDKYDESPDDMAGFEIRIKKPVEFRAAMQGGK